MSFIKSGDVDIHYMSAGPVQEASGPATLWVHGAGGNAAIWWQQAEHFAKSRQVIAYDVRAFGRSVCAMEDITVDAMRSDAIAVMDDCGVGSAAVICQSLGGWTGVQLALNAPERVDKLVLSCTMAGVNHPPAFEALMASQSNMDERGPASIAIGAEMAAENPFKDYLYQQSGFFNTAFDASKLGGIMTPETMVPIDALQDIKCPVLLISGDNDAIWPAGSLAGLVGAFPNARQEIIEGSGHSPYFERPEAFNKVVEAFLSE